MGLRGPQAKPTGLRLIAGNPSKRPLNADEPVPEAGPLTAPAGLFDAAAQAEWDRLVPMLEATKITRPIDVATVIQWCLTWSRFLSAIAHTKENGTTYESVNEKGDVKVREYPQAAEFRSLQSLLLLLSRELGITPAARSRITKVGGTGGKTRDQDEMRKKFFNAG